MADFPYLPLWTDAFLADTVHLTTAETGAYFLLLLSAWRTHDGGLPNDDKLLARYARCRGREWATMKARVLPFWTLGTDGLLRQKRLEREREFVTAKSAKAKSAAQAKWLKERETAYANASAKHMPKPRNASALIPTPIPIASSSENLTGAARGAALVASGSAPRAMATVLAEMAAKHRERT